MKITSIPLVLITGCLAIRVTGQVVLSEIMFNPDGSEQTDEYIEIFNLSESDAIDLSGWSISDGSGEDEIIQTDQGAILQPQQYGLILDADYFEQSTSYKTSIPIGALILTVNGSTLGSGGLSNSRAETVFLIRPDGNTADSVTYDIGIQPGHSYERINITADGSGWSVSETMNGTPGFVNSVAMRQFDLAVNSVRLITIDQEGSDTRYFQFDVHIRNDGSEDAQDASILLYIDENEDSLFDSNEQVEDVLQFSLTAGDTEVFSIPWMSPRYGFIRLGVICEWAGDEKPENNRFWTGITVPYPACAVLINEIMADPLSNMPEWVEIINRLSVDIDMQFWSLSDTDTSNRLFITESLYVPSDGYCILAADSTIFIQMDTRENTFIFNRTLGLNNDGDAVCLFDPSGELIDAIHYSSSWGGGTGVSLERIDVVASSEDSTNWIGCTFIEGSSPCRQNSVTPLMPVDEAQLHIAPNPFSPDGDGVDEVTMITVHTPDDVCRMNLSIYDIRGRKIRDLRKGMVSASSSTIVWDGNDNTGRRARIGLYIVLAETLNGEHGVVSREKASVILATSLNE